MAPNRMECINQLISMILNPDPAGKRLQPSNPVRKRLQSIIFFPPLSEPSFRETQQRWERVLERRRIENHIVVAQELEKRNQELRDISKMENTELVVWKHIDSIKAFLLELHSPPSLESYALAMELQEAEKIQLHVETQAEIDLKLYRTIMESEPLVGDHWQTDIYAGSSESSLDSPPPSDWDSDSKVPNENVKPVPVSNELLRKSIFMQDESKTSCELAEVEDQETFVFKPGLQKLDTLTRDAYWLKPAAEIMTSQLPELVAVREVLSALLNVGGDIIYSVSPGSRDPITLSENALTLFNISRATSCSLLSSFLPILTSLQKLRNSSQSNYYTPDQIRPTEEAYAASLLDLLQSFDVFLTSIELQLLNLPGVHNLSGLNDLEFRSVVSLMGLYHQLDQDGWIELFAALAAALPESVQGCDHEDDGPTITKVLLDKLYRLTCQFDSHCSSVVAVQRMKVIFLKTCEPVWSWVGDWILHGRLPEPPFTQESHRPLLKIQMHHDFFIRGIASGASNTVENWWEDRYLLKKESIPEFLQEFAVDILEGGKAMALSRILMIPADTRSPQWPKVTELMKQSQPVDEPSNQPADTKLHNGLRRHLRRSVHSSRCPKTSGPDGLIKVDPWPSRFHLNLYSHIKQNLGPLISLNHSHLHTQFFSPLKLSTYINELNDFFLLGSKSSVYFIKKIFDDANDFSKSNLLSAHPLLSTTHWWEDQVINANLSKALEYSPSSIISSCLLKVKTSPSIRLEEDPIKSLEAIQITMSIPTPLNYVFNSAHVTTYYNKCFVFLSQLARAAWTLDSLIWVRPTLPLGSTSATKEFESRSESKEFFRLKNRLGWFVNLITDYCMNLVIFKWKISFALAIDRHLGDLTHTIRHTRHWLDRLIRLMFLSDQCQPLNQAILQVLGLCIKTHETWVGFNRRANTFGLLKDINQTYVDDTERRKRKLARRKRRMRNEQYALIEEESRHMEVNLDDRMGTSAEDRPVDGDEADETYDQSANPASQSFLSTALQHSMIDQDHDDTLARLQQMNLEFERLLTSFQRAVGKLCRAIALKHDHLRPSDGPSNASDILPIASQTSSAMGVGDSEDLDTLTLLECRLDEWIV